MRLITEHLWNTVKNLTRRAEGEVAHVVETHELCTPHRGIRVRVEQQENYGSILLPMDQWSLGTQIQHPKFGFGMLVRIQVMDDGTKRHIFEFNEAELKK